jgi:hypothetical protein
MALGAVHPEFDPCTKEAAVPAVHGMPLKLYWAVCSSSSEWRLLPAVGAKGQAFASTTLQSCAGLLQAWCVDVNLNRRLQAICLLGIGACWGTGFRRLWGCASRMTGLNCCAVAKLLGYCGRACSVTGGLQQQRLHMRACLAGIRSCERRSGAAPVLRCI